MALDKPPVGTGSAVRLGRYVLVKELAGSGVGSTWIARPESDASEGQRPRLFSILRLHKHVTKRVEVAEAILQEARHAQKLKHPNVVTVIETGVADGEVFVVSEYVEGETLAGLLAAAGSEGLPLDANLRIALDVLEALSAAHGNDTDPLVHGELNPWQVIVSTGGSAKVANFGIARALARIGTHGIKNHDRLSYGAPERVKAMAASTQTPPPGPLDPRSDLFSLAVMLWEGLARQRLFASKMEAAVIQKVLTAPIPSLQEATATAVPAEIEQAIQKGLERDPARRFPNANEFIFALEEAGPDKIALADKISGLLQRLCGKVLASRKADLDAALVMPIAASGGRGPAAPRPRAATLLGIPPGGGMIDNAGPVAATVPNNGAPVEPALAPPVNTMPAPPPTMPQVSSAGVTPVPARHAPAAAAGEVSEPSPTPLAAVAQRPEPPFSTAEAVTTAPVISLGIEAPSPKPEPTPVAPAVRPRMGAAANPKRPRVTTLMGFAPKPPAGTPQPPGARAEAPTRPEVPKGPELGADSNGAAAARPPLPPKPGPGKPPTAPPRKFELPKPPTRLEPPKAKPAAAVGTPHVPEPRAEARPPKPPPPPGARLDTAPLGTRSSTEPPSPVESRPRGRLGDAVEKVGPGATLGRYEILMPVARGGMASVWAARLQGSRGFQKTVAIKTMLPDVSDDPDFETMFLDEARVAARIRHPNVAEILDLGDENDVLYIVMEWVDGETVGALQRAAKTHGGIPLPIVLRVASQVCAGLHAAHELRDDSGAMVDLIHRDISPANVLISSQGFVKIVDFGIAKSKGRMHVTRVGDMVKGKTPYLSPEQLGGMHIDRRSDIFSLGALLYVLTTGLHPFRGETDIKTVENIALKAPVPLREILPDLNADFEKVVLKALEKDANKRFATAAEMQRALDQVASSIGNPVTDDDVAAFMKKVLGEMLEKRGAELKAAIAAADADRGPVSAPPPAVIVGTPHTPPVADPPSFDELESVDIIASERPQALVDAMARATYSEPPAAEPRADIETDTAVAIPSEGADRRKRIATMAVAGAVAGGLILVAMAMRSGDDKKPVATTPQRVEAPVVTPPPVLEPPPPAPVPEPPAATVAATEPEPPATATPEPTAEPLKPSKTAKPAPTPKPVAKAAPTKPATKPATKPPTTTKTPATKPTSTSGKKFNPKGI